MGKVLSYKEAFENLNIIIDIIRTHEIESEHSSLSSQTVKLIVIAEVGGNIVMSKSLPVQFGYENNYTYSSRAGGSDFYNINIDWGIPKSIFNLLGLYGFYSTDYNKIEYDEDDKNLVIYGDSSKITIFFI